MIERIKTWWREKRREKTILEKIEDMVDNLDDMSIIARIEFSKFDDFYLLSVMPFHDVKLGYFFMETNDVENLFDELKIFYDEAKTKEFFDNITTFLTRVGMAYVYVWTFLTSLLALAGILFAITVIQRAGLSEEVLEGAWQIINIAKDEILTWMPFN